MPIPTHTEPNSDIDLEDYPKPIRDEYGRLVDALEGLYSILSCTRYNVGTWDELGVRVLPVEESYASVHFRIPAALPADSARQLAKFSTQRIPYTDRDREWDAIGGGPNSARERWSAFVDSVHAAVDFAHAALESAVWAHARGEEWTWPFSAPGRDESKYESWGDKHPATYDPYSDDAYFKYLESAKSEESEGTAVDTDEVVQF